MYYSVTTKLGSTKGLHYSVTRLGGFSKFLATNFLIKVAQIYGNFWGYLEECYFLRRACFITFRQLLENMGYS